MLAIKVLIIEDDREVPDYIAKGLKEAGHLALQAFDGKEGLFLATTESFDVLLVDHMLPFMDGYTFTLGNILFPQWKVSVILLFVMTFHSGKR